MATVIVTFRDADGQVIGQTQVPVYHAGDELVDGSIGAIKLKQQTLNLTVTVTDVGPGEEQHFM